jgi:hypothetical protein
MTVHRETESYLRWLARRQALVRCYIVDAMDAAKDPVTGVILMFRGLEQIVRDPGIEAGIGDYGPIPSTAQTAPMLAVQRAFEAASVAGRAGPFRPGRRLGRHVRRDHRADESRCAAVAAQIGSAPHDGGAGAHAVARVRQGR